MSFFDLAVGGVFCVTVMLIAGAEQLSEVLADFRDRLAGPDRRRHIAACSLYDRKLAVDSAILAADSAAEMADRLRSGAALAEGMFLTLEEIHALPETEPFRWLA